MKIHTLSKPNMDHVLHSWWHVVENRHLRATNPQLQKRHEQLHTLKIKTRLVIKFKGIGNRSSSISLFMLTYFTPMVHLHESVTTNMVISWQLLHYLSTTLLLQTALKALITILIKPAVHICYYFTDYKKL